MSRNLILKAAVIGEGGLLVLALGWYFFSETRIPLTYSTPLLFWGIIATIPVFVLNLGCYILSQKFPAHLRQISRFSKEIVIPLCRNLDPFSALVIALLSGICEEVFFRGFLLDLLRAYFSVETAILGSSLVFAYAHLVGLFRTYWLIFLIYLAIAFYFSFLTLYFSSLLPAIVSHTLYNFVAILYLHYYSKSFEEPSES